MKFLFNKDDTRQFPAMHRMIEACLTETGTAQVIIRIVNESVGIREYVISAYYEPEQLAFPFMKETS